MGFSLVGELWSGSLYGGLNVIGFAVAGSMSLSWYSAKDLKISKFNQKSSVMYKKKVILVFKYNYKSDIIQTFI